MNSLRRGTFGNVWPCSKNKHDKTPKSLYQGLKAPRPDHGHGPQCSDLCLRGSSISHCSCRFRNSLFLALLDIHTEVMTFGHSDGKLMLISNQVNGSALLVLSGFFATDSL